MNRDFLSKKREEINVTRAIELANTSSIRGQLIPSQLGAGWPYLSKKNDVLCATIPYYGTQRNEKSVLLYPLSHLLTITLTDGRIVYYNNLAFDREYKDIDFAKPCGEFKHAAIADYTREQYEKERAELFALYDELSVTLKQGVSFPKLQEMRKIFSRLMEPGEYQFYCRLAPKFFANYCGGII